jgi:hypothetical protein
MLPVEDQEFQTVTEFKYLGSTITTDTKQIIVMAMVIVIA